MIRRLIEQRKAIDEFAVLKRNYDFTLSAENWSNLAELINILHAFEDITKLFCSARISVVIPYANSLHKLVSSINVKNECFITMCQKMKEEIEDRFIKKFDQRF
jgi:hypothetical protein